MDKTEWKKWIDEQREKVKDEYIITPERLIQDYRQEIELNKQYNGRQLLELLQNADDESHNIQKPQHALIKLEENKLIIANNGKFFSKEGIKSLRFARITGKKHRLGVIGYKGLGFRSILNWAKEICIISGELSVKYSEEIADEFLSVLISEKPSLKQTIEENRVATLSIPKWIEEPHIKNKEYDTYIILELKESIIKDLENQIMDLKPETLIFLNNLTQIIIDTPWKKGTIIADRRQKEKIKIEERGDDGQLNFSKEWSIRSIKDTIPDNLIKSVEDPKEYHIKIAFHKSLDDSINRLFCYFITKEKFPFPFLIHATLNLDDSRNNIVEDEINKFLLEKIAEMLVGISIELNKDIVNWDRLKFLAKRGEFGDTIDKLGFYDFLVNKIKEKEIIPTKSGYKVPSYTYYYNFRDLNEILSKYEEFKDLAFFTEDTPIKDLIEKLDLNKYTEDELVSKLNKISESLIPYDRAKIIKSICKNRLPLFSWNYKRRPSLFVDNHREIIKSNFDLVLPPEGSFEIGLPDWVTIKFIDTELVRLLHKEFETKTIRDLRNDLSFFNVQEYSFSNFIRSIISSAEKLYKNTNNTEVIKELLQILFSIYKSKKIEQFPETLQVPIINNKNEIKNSDEVYFGQDYKVGDIAYNLLKEIDSSLFLASKENLGFNNVDEDYLIEFLKWIRVSPYPRLILKELKEDYLEYRLYALKNLNYPLELRGEVYRGYEDLERELHSHTKIKIQDVDLFEQILQKADFEYILTWFIRDSNIHEIIRTGKERGNNSELSLSLYRKQDYRVIKGQEIPAYLYWKLKIKSWVETSSGKKAITNCCLDNLNLSPLLESPKFNPNAAVFRKYGVETKDINFILSKLGVIEDISSLPWNAVYSLLLDLPNLDKEGNIAKSFYNKVIKDRSTEKLDKKDEKYKEYIKNGKLFGEHDKEKRYYPLNELYYLENRTLPKAILKRYPILSINRRVGAKKVEDILGVKQLNEDTLNIEIESHSQHRLNGLFQNEFENFKPYAYFYRVEKDTKRESLRSLKNLKIILCSNIEVKSDIPDLKLDSYEAIRKGNLIYILVTKNIDKLTDLSEDDDFCDTVSEIIMNSFKIVDDKTEREISELLSKGVNRDRRFYKFHSDGKDLLEKCRGHLGLILINKKEFWETIFDIKVKKLNEDIQTDKQLFLEVRKEFEKVPVAIYEKIDYENYNNIDNFNLFKTLFNILEISVLEFNAKSYKKINFAEYLSSKIEKLIISFEENFKITIFNRLKGNPKQQKEFKGIIKEYNNLEFDGQSVTNTLIDIKEHFFQLINKKFSVSQEELQKKPDIDLNGVYNTNYNKIKNELKSKNFDETEIIRFLENDDNSSRIYFGNEQELIKEFEETHEPATITKPTQKTPEEKLKETLAKIENEIMNSPPDITRVEIKKPLEEQSLKTGRKGKSPSSSYFSDDEKEEIGIIGEKIIYERLKIAYGKDSIKWVSTNAKKAGINPEGNDNYGYDIHYKENGSIKFVEVKSSKNDATTFHISRDEVKFGERNKDDYELWLVLNCMSEEKRKIVNLGNIFKYKTKEESFSNNLNFSVENEKFIISFDFDKN